MMRALYVSGGLAQVAKRERPGIAGPLRVWPGTW
jgi:hypothetical protein